MSAIVDRLTARGMVLFNESFAATNEREGSEIARQVVSALLDRGVTTVFVTHHYTFAHGFAERDDRRVLFLRAERGDDGTRTFALREGPPRPTSFGMDLYERIFAGFVPSLVSARSPAP
jgi:DNA mismatch repair ATPase MutS